MLTFVFGIIDAFLPIIIMFFIFRIIMGILRSVLGSSTGKIPEQNREHTEEAAAEPADIVKEFEKKLRAKAKSKPAQNKQDNVVTDDELAVYKEQQDMFAKLHAIKAQPALAEAEKEKATKKRFVHQRLAEGFIMSQILDKPRSIKPYEDSF